MSDFIAIETLINDYFQALHSKDVAKIEAIFGIMPASQAITKVSLFIPNFMII